MTYERALKAFAEGDLVTALDALDALRAQGLSSPEIVLYRGIALFGLSRFEEAKEALLEAAREAPNDGQPYFYLGLLAISQKDLLGARSFLEKARALLPPENPLAIKVQLLLEEIPKEEPPPPRKIKPSARLLTVAQFDSNALLSSVDAAASDISGARFLVDGRLSTTGTLGRRLGAEVQVGVLSSLPVVNVEALAPLDPSGGQGHLALEARAGKAQNKLLGVSLFGRLLRRDFWREPFLAEMGGVAAAEYQGERFGFRLAYRVSKSDFFLGEDIEGTAIDQDNLGQEIGLFARMPYGFRAALLLTQAEADGNSFDRRGAEARLGFLYQYLDLASVDLYAGLGGVSFPNGEEARFDTRLFLGGEARWFFAVGTLTLTYNGIFNRSSLEVFSFDRHLVSLGMRWTFN